MSRKSIVIIGYILATFLVVGGTILLVAYGNGYIYSFKTGKLVQRGLLLLNSVPTGATVQLNGKPIADSTPFRRTMEEGRYDFKLEREGFRTWKKAIQVVPSRVSQHQYVIMLPHQPKATQIATFPGISQSMASRDNRRLAYVVSSGDQVGLWSLDTGNRRQTRLYVPAPAADPAQLEALTILDWSSDNSRVLIRRSNGVESSLLLVAANGNEPPISVTDTFGVNPESLAFSPTNRQQLYWYIEGGLRRLDVGNASVTPLLTGNVAGYGFADGRIIYVNTATSPFSLWSLDSGGQRKKLTTKLPAGAAFEIKFASYLGTPVMTVVATDTHKAMLYRDIFDKPIVRELKAPAVHALFNGDGRFVAFSDGTHLTTYDLQENKAYSFINGTNPVTGITWFDNYHLLFNRGGMAVLSEFDGNYANDLTASDVQAPTFAANTKSVVVTSLTASGSVQLKSVTVRQ